MKASHFSENFNVAERPVPPSVEAQDPYADIDFDGAYVMVQKQVIEFAGFQSEAIESGDFDKVGRAIALGKHVVRAIETQLSFGYLTDDEVSEEDLHETAQRYFSTSLDRYREYGPDPRLTEQQGYNSGERNPVVGVNASQEEYDTHVQAELAAGSAPDHIAEIPISDLSKSEQKEERRLQRSFKKIVKGLGRISSKGADLILPKDEFIIRSGEISTLRPGEPTKTLDAIEQ